MTGRESSSGKLLVRGQKMYICLPGSRLRRMPRKLVELTQSMKFRKKGDSIFRVNEYKAMTKIARRCL